MEDRFDRLEQKLDQKFAEANTQLGARIDGVEAKLGAVEAKLGARIDGVEMKLGGVEAALGARIDGVETKLGGVEAALGARIGGVETKLGGVEAQIGGLAGELRAVETRLRGHIEDVEGHLSDKLMVTDLGLRGHVSEEIATLGLKVDVLHEDVKSDFRFSLEARDGLKEQVERRFQEQQEFFRKALAPLEAAVRRANEEREARSKL